MSTPFVIDVSLEKNDTGLRRSSQARVNSAAGVKNGKWKI
jgi:hypothetical protein